MFPEEYLKKIPEDQHAVAEDVFSVLYEIKKENKMGLNVTNIQERTHIIDCGMRNAECGMRNNPKSEIRNPKSNARVYYATSIRIDN
ncbi:MAG: hypothetical protein ACE5KE_03980 [Methanosarcinales archaeon]